jgi:outer membrane lipoprotein-sorting protein
MRSRTVAIAFLLFVVASNLPCFAEPDFVAMLKRVDGLVTFDQSDFSAEYAITQTKPGEGKTTTKAAIFRRDKNQKYLILILEPKGDRGKGYLKIDQGLWLYDPKARKFDYTSSKERFQNSNARNSDFTRSNFAGDYRIVGSKRERLGSYDCWVLNLKASSADVAFPISKLWISDDNLVRKTEDYSLSGQLLRTTAMPSYQQVGSRFIPSSITIVDALRGKKIGGTFLSETTEISISKPSLEKLPDALFTKAYLEKFGK